MCCLPSFLKFYFRGKQSFEKLESSLNGDACSATRFSIMCPAWPPTAAGIALRVNANSSGACWDVSCSATSYQVCSLVLAMPFGKRFLKIFIHRSFLTQKWQRGGNLNWRFCSCCGILVGEQY